MFINDKFDIPIFKSRNQLHVETEYTYFMSLVEPGEYVLKKFSHNDMDTTTVKSSIKINEVIGRCFRTRF